MVTPRPEEKYAASLVENYLKYNYGFTGEVTKVTEDPPDYFIIQGRNRIALEVTIAEPTYEGERPDRKRRTLENSVSRFCDKLNTDFTRRIPRGISLLPYFKMPVEDYNKFKNETRSKILSFLDGGLSCQRFDVDKGLVEIKRIMHNDYWRKPIIVMVGVSNPIFSLQTHVSKVLTERINVKTKKLERVNEEKWLVVFNNYLLAEPINFKKALGGLNISHSFSKILLINNDTVIEL